MKIEKLEIEEYPILIMELYQGSYGSLGSVSDRHIEGLFLFCANILHFVCRYETKRPWQLCCQGL